ncbi:NADH dehydrogenase [ubiquinone] 1 alpha subcomplex subunit 13 [Halotydeus destructor]|nr:NADH dehydrogenase [ubiquinone] 1 alpha subcomplex subunit 13 [Halotydeus destructor]
MATFRQDMPPAGGYAPVHYARVPHKRFWTGWRMFGLFVLTSGVSLYRGMRWKLYMKKLEVEKYDSLLALHPFITAERDRAYLKHLRHLREQERELMKNHTGWEVGTLYGEPIYRTIPKDAILQIDINEYYAHRPPLEVLQDHVWPDAWL